MPNDLSIRLTLNSGAFSSAIQAARSGVSGLAASVKQSAESIRGAFSTIGSALSGPLALLGLGGGFAGITLLVKDSMEAVAATGRLSDRLGITTESLTGLQYAAKLAGISSEDLTIALGHMFKNLGEAAEKGGDAADALKLLKLDPKALVSGSPDEAFNKIADGLRGLHDPFQRAQAAQDLFGKSGQQLLPLMLQGSEGIKAAEAEAAKLGLTFSRVDAAKVELANQSFVRMQAVVTGVTQTLAIQMAPFITALGNKLVALGTEGGGIGKKIGEGFVPVILFMGHAADAGSLVAAGWQYLRGAASYAIGGILDGIGYLIDGLNKLTAKLHITAIGGAQALHDLGKAFYSTGSDAFAAGKADFDSAADAKGYKSAKAGVDSIESQSQQAAQQVADDAKNLNGGKFIDVDDKQEDKAKASLQELRDQLDAIKQATAQGIDPKYAEEIAKLKLDPGQAKEWITLKQQVDAAKKAFDDAAKAQEEIAKKKAELADLKAGKDPAAAKKTGNPELDALNEQIELVKKRNELLAKAETPLDRYRKALDEINKMEKAGLLDSKQADDLTKQAGKTYDDETKKDTPKPIDVKAETRRSILDLPQTTKSDNDAAKQAVMEQQKTNSTLDTMSGNLFDLWRKWTGTDVGTDSSTNIDNYA